MHPRFHPFRPRLPSALAGCHRSQLLADLGAGLTVGTVALPPAMAVAIALGVKPEAGIFTAIIVGFLISALGGSLVQIGGPADGLRLFHLAHGQPVLDQAASGQRRRAAGRRNGV